MFGFLKVAGLNRRQYNAVVKERLENVIHLETDNAKNPRFCGTLTFLQLIDEGWHAKLSPDDTAIHIALSYFMGCAKGDESDTKEGLRVYQRLEAFIRVARDKNLITSQRFEQFREVLDKYYTMIGDRVLERLQTMLPPTERDQDGGKRAYEAAVNTHLKDSLKLDADRDPRMVEFQNLIDAGWLSSIEPVDVSIQIGAAFYIAHKLGSAADRAEVSPLYTYLKMALSLACLEGKMSYERGAEFERVIGHATRQAILKDMDEGTFASD